MTEYRYTVDDHDGTITRGRVYCLRDTGCDTSDTWQWYWDGDGIVAFTEGWHVGRPEYHDQTGGGDDTDRVIEAIKAHREYGDDEPFIDMLNRPGGLAFRLTGNWGARFITVNLDRAYDLYALSWDGDPDHEWRDEIEALHAGEIYRMETAAFNPAWPDNWEPQDDWCEEWYGQDKADAALERAFPLSEFPAELLVEDRAS